MSQLPEYFDIVMGHNIMELINVMLFSAMNYVRMYEDGLLLCFPWTLHHKQHEFQTSGV